MTRSSLGQRIAWAIAILVFTACGDSVQDPNVIQEPEPQGPPTQIVAISADSFSGVVGTQLTEPLRVRVTDADGQGVSGVAVDFRVTSGFGTITVPATGGLGLVAGGSAQALVADSTDANGEAEARWTLGTGAGTQTARAFVNNVGTVTFTAIAEADAPTQLFFSITSPLGGPKGSEAHSPIAAIVADQFENAVSGVTVSWSAVSAGASVGAASSVTNDSGLAEVTATLGLTHGIYLYTASLTSVGPDTIGILAVDGVEDPSGDAGPSGDPTLRAPDITFVGAAVVDTTLWLYLRFADPVDPNSASGSQPEGAVIGRFELDVDQDSATGYLPVVNCFLGDSVPIGVDALADLDARLQFLVSPPFLDTIPGAVMFGIMDSTVTDRCAHVFIVARTEPFFAARALALAVPLSALDDDGVMDILAFVASPAQTGNFITDIVPDSLFYTFLGSDAPLSVRMAGAGGAPEAWRYLVSRSVERSQLYSVIRRRAFRLQYR